MLFFTFFIVAFLVVIFSIGVSFFAEKIEASLVTKSAIVGMILLALATSLPELTTAIVTARDNHPELLLSNVFGSNFFNLLILATMQLVFWKHNVLSKIPKSYIVSYSLLLIMHVVIFLSLGIIHTTNIFTFIPSLLLVLLYYLTIRFSPGNNSEENKIKEKNGATPFILFFIFALFLIGSAVVLVQTVEKISDVYQLSSLFAGSILIGVITSLPELVAAITLTKRKQYTLMIEAIIGSNILNFFILVIGDFMMIKNSIFSVSDTKTFLIYLLFLTISSCLLFLSIFLKIKNQRIKKVFPYIMSTSIFVIYVFTFFI